MKSFLLINPLFFNLFGGANCKCKLDTCTVELSESERRSGWKPLASVLGDAAAAFGCVNRVEELVNQNEGSKQPVVAFVLGTFPRSIGMCKVDCTAPVLDLTERRELRAVVHGNALEDL